MACPERRVRPKRVGLWPPNAPVSATTGQLPDYPVVPAFDGLEPVHRAPRSISRFVVCSCTMLDLIRWLRRVQPGLRRQLTLDEDGAATVATLEVGVQSRILADANRPLVATAAIGADGDGRRAVGTRRLPPPDVSHGHVFGGITYQ